MIPVQLKERGIRFVLLERSGKKPFQPSWQTKNIEYDNVDLINHIKSGGNFGVMGGGEKNLLIVDFDDKKVQSEIISKLPQTFTIKTGSGMMHKYFFSNQSKSFKIFDDEMNTLVDVQGTGKQAVCAGSIHPNGNRYEVIENTPIAYIEYSELQALIMPYDKKTKDIKVNIETPKEYSSDNFLEIVKARVNIESVLNEFGVNTTRNPSNCPFHSSKGGKCLSWNGEVAHCFHCDGSWNIFSLVKEFNHCEFKEALNWIVEKYNLQREHEESKKKYFEKINIDKGASVIFSKKGQAQEFSSRQPIFYDRSGLWWLWDKKDMCWKMVDEVDVLNMIEDVTGADIISSKSRNELLNSLKQEGRKNIPTKAPVEWIQFKNGIVDINNPTILLVPNPSYFITNPIPWNLGKSSETPNMDKIFKEWVGEDYVQTLYEILAYCLLSDYPLHKIFCFIGSGMNGKSKFLDLLRIFIGLSNCCSTELDTLLSSRFEVARLYKKLVCQMGETNFGELSKTSMLKKLSGGDLIGYEFKGKTPFEDKNYAKILISTNNLPATTDKTIGFYRRWLIIDFPNTFSERKDILSDIPAEEYENLALKCCLILNRILSDRQFSNEGSIEERIQKYEAKSNFLEKFIREYVKESNEGYITKADFYKKFMAWSKENRHREMSEQSVTKAMKGLGYNENKKHFHWLYDGKGGQARIWEGIVWC